MKHYTQTTTPAREPVTAQELAEFMRIGCAPEELASIAGFVAAARDAVESYTGRALMVSGWSMACDGWCAGVLTLDRSPLAAVSAVKYWPADGGAQVTLDPSEYLVIAATQPGRVQITGDLPALADRADAVQIDFTAGVSDAGAIAPMLRHAVRIQAADYYEKRTEVGDMSRGVRNILESQRVGGWVA